MLVALLWAAFVAVAVHALDFPGSVRDFQKQSGGGTLLDVSPSFSEEATYARLEAFGERGRKNYLFRNLTVDILLPLSVVPFLFLLMQRSIRAVPLRRATRLLLLSIPLAYVVFDLVENGLVIALLSAFPDRLRLVTAALPFITVVKRAASMLALAIPLVILLFASIRGRLQKIPGST